MGYYGLAGKLEGSIETRWKHCGLAPSAKQRNIARTGEQTEESVFPVKCHHKALTIILEVMPCHLNPGSLYSSHIFFFFY
jgi:hypothetical protein